MKGDEIKLKSVCWNVSWEKMKKKDNAGIIIAYIGLIVWKLQVCHHLSGRDEFGL